MPTETLILAIHRELQHRFRAAGPGSIGRIEASLELSQGYFRDQRRSDRLRIDLRVLLRTLELLGVDRADFFATVLGSSDPALRFRNEGLLLCSGRQRSIPILQAVEKRHLTSPPANQPLDLAVLDTERYDRPKEIERQARTSISKVPAQQVIPLLGIYASACRGLGKVSRAQTVLAKALELAQDAPQQVIADLLLRSASVLGDQGRFRFAADLAEKAIIHSTLAADRLGIAKALLKLGMAQGCAGQQDEEILSFQAALGILRQLPDEASPSAGEATHLELRRNLFSVLTNLALAHHQRQDFEQAEGLAHQAEDAATDLGPTLSGKLVWLRGTIAWQLQRLADAETHLRRALELHRPRAPLSSALIAVDLVKVQLQRGEIAEATRTARAMTALVSSLERHPVALAAITQLIRSALEGKGLSSAVEAAAQRLKNCGELNPALLKGWSRRSAG